MVTEKQMNQALDEVCTTDALSMPEVNYPTVPVPVSDTRAIYAANAHAITTRELAKKLHLSIARVTQLAVAGALVSDLYPPFKPNLRLRLFAPDTRVR